MKGIKIMLTALPLMYFISCSGPQTENKVEATEPAAEQQTSGSISAGATYTLQNDQSNLKWMGSNKFTPKKHEGTIQFSSGSFSVADNQITGGNFVADMNSLSSAGDEFTNGQEYVGKLVGHLKSPDFFDVTTFPTSTFTISSVKPLEGNPAYNHEVTGSLTIKGITKEITFPANVSITGTDISASSTFPIDRSQWEVKYGSESFFPDLVKDKFISNKRLLEFVMAHTDLIASFLEPGDCALCGTV